MVNKKKNPLRVQVLKFIQLLNDNDNRYASLPLVWYSCLPLCVSILFSCQKSSNCISCHFGFLKMWNDVERIHNDSYSLSSTWPRKLIYIINVTRMGKEIVLKICKGESRYKEKILPMLRKNEKTNVHLFLDSHYYLSDAVSVVHETFSELKGLEFYWHSCPSTH